MENPATWTEYEWTIHNAYQKWLDDTDAGMIGHSLAKRITIALREKGLIKEDQ